MSIKPEEVSQSGQASGDTNSPGVSRKSLAFLPGLEGLRGFALFVVLLVHTGLYISAGMGNWMVPGGEIVMSIFFVLSGFLITALLLMEYDRHGQISVRRFLRKRGRRLLPPLVLMLVLHWLLILYYNRSVALEWRQDIWAASFLINYKYSIHGQDPLMGADIKILWSVAIEGQFYLFWPFLLMALKRHAKTTKRIAAWLIGFIALSTVIRVTEYHVWGVWTAVYYRTEGRLDAFFIGALLSFAWYEDLLPMKYVKQLAWIAWIIFIPSLWILRLQAGYFYTWGMFMFNVLSAIAIAACFDNDFILTKILSVRLLRLAGRVSYSFYIIHIQVFFWVTLERSYLPVAQRIALAWSVTLVLGLLMYVIAERPFVSRPSLKVNKPTPLGAAAD